MEGSCGYVPLSKHNNEVVQKAYPASEVDIYDGSESGVEPDYAEWLLDSNVDREDVLLDLSDDQAMAALRYFTSTAQRTNMLTKTHSNDLDLISQLLADKEKDLEMTAKIGQSLLQRNKQLMMKIETMEDYLSQTTENAAQLEHDLQMKNKLVRLYTQDEDEARSTTSSSSKEDKGFDDQELVNLTNRCRKLERENQNLFTEALSLRQMTEEIEDKEEGLVIDCIEQLASAKEQITQLTDEIALKFEDNLQQQLEISQLINTVVELQKKQKQLVEENEGLQEQLMVSTQSQENLREQLHEMQMKFRETNEMMQIHQEELKSLKSQLELSGNPYDWVNESANSISLQDSLANEIEESVRRDLESSLEKNRLQNRRLLENVRYLNKAGSDTTSGRTSPVSTWSFASDERSESASTLESDRYPIRKPTRKLQIVKPLEGSDTLNKWHHLASKNVKGGLNIAEEKNITIGESDPQVSTLDANISIAVDSPSVSEKSNIDSTTDDDGIAMHQTPKRIGEKSSLNLRPRLLSEISTPQKRTIITRNSSVLKSLRDGRRMLKSKQKDGRSQADVIGMIANAMGKVHLEENAGKRILSSLSSPSTHERSGDLPPRLTYENMPNVTKALEKAAQINEEELELNESLNPDYFDGKVEPESDNSNYDSGAEGLTYSTITPSERTSERRSSTRTSSVEISSTTDNGLHGITGPLGLLNRAKPTKENPEILNELLRFSATQNDLTGISDSSSNIDKAKMTIEEELRTPNSNNSRFGEDTNSNLTPEDSSKVTLRSKNIAAVLENEGSSMRRNNSSGSLVEMVLNKRLSSRPVGLSNVISGSNASKLISTENHDIPLDGEELDFEVDDKTRTNMNETSKSLEAGLDNVSKDEGSGLFGFFSFLGKLS